MEVTAHDVAFTVNTVLELQIPGNWSVLVDPSVVAGAEALDDHTVKFSFSERPGLARWEFGLSQSVVLPKHYWESIVAAARDAGAIEDQQRSLFGHDALDEPTAGEMVFGKLEPGAFIEMKLNPNYFWSGSVVEEYANGAYVEEIPGLPRYQDYGEPGGDPVLSFTRGPHVTSVIFNLLGDDQNTAVIELRSGNVDFVLSPQGFAPQLRRHLEGQGIGLVDNAPNDFNFLGFNVRRAPMDSKVFRQAVATLIDKEFITNVLLQNIAVPVYTLVPEGNSFWWNPDVPEIGRGLTQQQRIEQAVAMLKAEGFTWDVEPVWNEQKRAVDVGEGLRMPNGEPVPEMTLLSLSAGYDPMRATAAVWIERWLNEAGIPVKSTLTGFNELIPKVIFEQDFDTFILGRKLTIYPTHLVDLFHSSQAAPGGNNPGGYNNPEFEQLADEFIAETDLLAARDKAFQLQEILAEELPMVVLFSVPIIEAYRSDSVDWAFIDALDGLQQYFQSMNGPLSFTVIQ